MSWTDERVEMLKKLWADGLSASQIAAELGGVTRNAVIGKVHRLGLAGRAKSTRTSTPRPRTKPKAPKPTPRLPQFSGNAALRMDTEEAPMPVARPKPVLEEIVIPEAERATILDLNEHRCKWPVGDPTQPDFYFCGRHSGRAARIARITPRSRSSRATSGATRTATEPRRNRRPAGRSRGAVCARFAARRADPSQEIGPEPGNQETAKRSSKA